MWLLQEIIPGRVECSASLLIVDGQVRHGLVTEYSFAAGEGSPTRLHRLPHRLPNPCAAAYPTARHTARHTAYPAASPTA